MCEVGTSLAVLQGACGVHLYGGRGVGKSSLALQPAIKAAIGGRPSLVLCSQDAVANKMPKPPTPLNSLSEEVLTLIEFCYIRSAHDATTALLSMTFIPSVIIVEEDFEEVGTNVRDAAKLLALLDNTIRWIRRKHDSSAFYILVGTDSIHNSHHEITRDLARAHLTVMNASTVCVTVTWKQSRHVLLFMHTEEGLKRSF